MKNNLRYLVNKAASPYYLIRITGTGDPLIPLSNYTNRCDNPKDPSKDIDTVHRFTKGDEYKAFHPVDNTSLIMQRDVLFEVHVNGKKYLVNVDNLQAILCIATSNQR